MSGCGLHCLKIQHITVKAGDTLLVDDVSLHAHCGELTAVIGRNGAGKSTLFKAILGEIRHTGTVEFSGHDGRRPTGTPRIGYVPQTLNVDKGSPATVLDMALSFTSRYPAFLPRRKKAVTALESHFSRFAAAGQAGGPPVGGRAAAGAAGRRHPSSARPSDTGRAGFRRGQRRPPAFL